MLTEDVDGDGDFDPGTRATSSTSGAGAKGQAANRIKDSIARCTADTPGGSAKKPEVVEFLCNSTVRKRSTAICSGSCTEAVANRRHRRRAGLGLCDDKQGWRRPGNGPGKHSWWRAHRGLILAGVAGIVGVVASCGHGARQAMTADHGELIDEPAAGEISVGDAVGYESIAHADWIYGCGGEQLVLKLAVQGMHTSFGLTSNDIEALFRRFGPLSCVLIAPDGAGAIAAFHDESHTRAALRGLHGRQLQGFGKAALAISVVE